MKKKEEEHTLSFPLSPSLSPLCSWCIQEKAKQNMKRRACCYEEEEEYALPTLLPLKQ